MSRSPRSPTATYRLQLHRRLTLGDAERLTDYLDALGISHLYASPLLRARRGSTHGYDVTEPRALNPELGDEADFGRLVGRLHARALGLVVDIVPNHVATSPENRAWDDVLRHGRRSPYARWFDIAWQPRARPDAPRRVVLAVLGRPLSGVIARDEIHLRVVRGELRVSYGGLTLPLAPGSIPAALGGRRGAELEAFTRGRAGRRRLAALLDRQHYRLACWREPHAPSYRRFFDINELIALRQEDPVVFADTHAKILDWVGRGWIDGLRIDHIDGLADPAAYLARLRDAVAARVPRRDPPAIWVEKIVAGDEPLRRGWPVAGTTGYEFLNVLDGALVAPRGVDALERWYERLTRRARSFEEVAAEAKREALRTGLRPDLDRLVAMTRAPAGVARAALRTAWIEVTTVLPVYRTYVSARAPRGSAADRRLIDAALATARRRGSAERRALAAVEGMLRPSTRAVRTRPRLECVLRWQQLSGPAAAKGVEDTALYRHVPLASLNEVGGEPDRPLMRAVARLHAANTARARAWPEAMLTVTTHDTKRSADVRARLHVLSEIADEWTATVDRWRARGYASGIDPATEYLLYQTLVGVWPAFSSPGRAPTRAARAALHDRIATYMTKATREAKERTSWIDPDPAFEEALGATVGDLLLGASATAETFRREMTTLVAGIARPGLWTALARTLLHLTAPGVPDIYQGDELWNFSLVDPDNRRPVDFARRRRALASLGVRPGRRKLAALLARPEDGRIKLHVVRTALRARRRDPALFVHGTYRPLRATGPGAPHVIAFLRTAGRRSAVVVVPRLSRTLTGGRRAPTGSDVWSQTMLQLPTRGRADYRAPLTGTTITVPAGGRIAVSQLLAELPVAMLLR